MKLFIVARNKKVVNAYKKQIINEGFEYSQNNPDIVLSLGGDGTYLIAEKMFPEIPKLMIRDSNICNKCSPKLFNTVISQLKDKKYKVEEWIKLEGNFKKSIMIAANDIIIRNKDQRQAIRFRVSVNNIPIRHEYIGDGVVLSTPWGATGYFYTITKKIFRKGLGIALNNTNTEKRDLVVKELSKIEIIITRGNAVLSFDNARKEFVMKTGDKLVVKKAKRNARMIKLKK